MWCHLCTKDYETFDDFRIHITKMHGNTSEFSRESSDWEESEHENAEDSEVYTDDKNFTINILPDKYYDSDNSLAENNISDDNTTALNAFIEKQYHSDDSVTEEKHSPPALLEKCNDDDENKVSALNVSLRKRRSYSKNENTSDVNSVVSNKLSKCKKSILKKCVQKKKKVAFSKKMLPKRKKSATSYQKNNPKDSDDNDTDHSVSSSNRDNNSNSQPVLNNNCFSSQPVSVNNYVNTQPICNNPVFLLNPYAGQSINNYLIGNQAIQPPVFVADPTIIKPTSLQNNKGFDFNSKNILEWLIKHKEFSKNAHYPLPQPIFNKIATVHKAIYDRYRKTTNKEEAQAVMKVYEDLDCMIQKHMNSINNALSY